MRRATQSTLAGACAIWGAACVALGACASVLGVDKSFELAADSGADAGLDASADAGADAGEDAASVGIRCAPNAAPCDPTSEECCFKGNDSLSCVSVNAGQGGDPCPNGTDIPCVEPASCPNGGACCLAVDDAGDILSTSCKHECPTGSITLCAAQGGTCPGTQKCAPITVTPDPPFGSDWFHACQ